MKTAKTAGYQRQGLTDHPPTILQPMKDYRDKSSSRRLRASLMIGSWLLVCCITVNAQFAIDWYTIDGGGGTSTGGVYSVSGTIGQPDAGQSMTGAVYSVTGGFWVVPTAVQTPGAPKLTIVASGAGQATVSWAPYPPGWVLQEKATLEASSWTNSPSGSTNPIVVPATLPSKFYRLFKEE